ncbi:UNVERIFIED_CONTAM: polynucleotide adenylyltransferase [Siphonaria sp. JEL0065]|nr:polynucleotide adenylyltransferase [Siphonaria sp. JEL0065]
MRSAKVRRDAGEAIVPFSSCVDLSHHKRYTGILDVIRRVITEESVRYSSSAVDPKKEAAAAASSSSSYEDPFLSSSKKGAAGDWQDLYSSPTRNNGRNGDSAYPKTHKKSGFKKSWDGLRSLYRGYWTRYSIRVVEFAFEDSDIDAVCVGPKSLTRDEFFEGMAELLKQRREVSEFVVIEDAHVPLLAFKFNGIDVDLAYAKLSVDHAPPTLNISHLKFLNNDAVLDERCVRSLNGVRMALEISSLLPSRHTPTLKTVTRALKFWAKQRGVYSNSYGFLGGVACLIIAVKACQQFDGDEELDPCRVLGKAFAVLYAWNWTTPFTIKPTIISGDQNPTRDYNNRPYKMPILTPTVPSVCCTNNVGPSSMVVMMKEFKRGVKMMMNFVSKKTGDDEEAGSLWKELMQPINVFQMYKFFIRVVAVAESESGLLTWAGLIQSRIPRLVFRLEAIENILVVHPIVKGFNGIEFPPPPQPPALIDTQKPTIQSILTKSPTLKSTSFFVGLSIVSGKQTINLSTASGEFIQGLKDSREFVDAGRRGGGGCSVFIDFVRRADIPEVLLNPVVGVGVVEKRVLSLEVLKVKEEVKEGTTSCEVDGAGGRGGVVRQDSGFDNENRATAKSSGFVGKLARVEELSLMNGGKIRSNNK